MRSLYTHTKFRIPKVEPGTLLGHECSLPEVTENRYFAKKITNGKFIVWARNKYIWYYIQVANNLANWNIYKQVQMHINGPLQ